MIMQLTIVLLITLSQFIPGYTVDFSVYWNAATVQCRDFGVKFDEMREQFNIRQNKNDSFIGGQIAVFHNPGMFPHINTSSGKVEMINGGLPQNGNHSQHLEVFRMEITKLISTKFAGVGILDLNYWRPIYRENQGDLDVYRNASLDLTPKSLNESRRLMLSEAEFEHSARRYVEETLEAAKKIGPSARWGYLGYPECSNFSPSDPSSSCSPEQQEANDGMSWLWRQQQIQVPLIDFSYRLTNVDKLNSISGRLNESRRIIREHELKSQLIPYLKLTDDKDEFISKDVQFITDVLKLMISHECAGVIVSVPPHNTDSKEECEKFHDFATKILGPAVNSTFQDHDIPPVDINVLDDDSENLFTGNYEETNLGIKPALASQTVFFCFALFTTRILVFI